MTLVAHLSDLHFGRIDPAIPPASIAALDAARPDLVVVSGGAGKRFIRSRAERFRREGDAWRRQSQAGGGSGT